MPQEHTANKEKILLEKLRAALLSEDRKSIAEVRQILESSEELAKRIDPIIENHLDELKEHFPDSYIRITQKLIDQRLKRSQQELVNILYPRLGLMMKSYIADQFKLMRERIDQQIRRSPLSFIMRNRNKTTDEIMMDLSPFKVEEVYVISHESGLLLGSASSSNTADKDMIAGMLTAIKSFVEDAFQRSDEELRGVQYREYEIMIHNFFNYYIALAIAGTSSESDRDHLANRILEFASKELNHDLSEPDAHLHGHLQKELTRYFMQPAKKTLE